jgi:hypothetical protein
MANALVRVAKVLALVLVVWLTTAGDYVTYATGQFTLKGDLCKPPGNGPFAAVVFNHGGAGTIIGGAPKETCAALAKAGFVGFSPIRRPTRRLTGHLGDVMAAVAHVKGLAYVDRDRIALIGFSRGGMLAFQAAARRDEFRALVIMATAFGRGRGGLDLDQARSIDAPVLVLVAANDTGSRRTHGMNTLAGSRKLAQALRAADKDVRLIVYPPYRDDGHTLFFTVGRYWRDVVAFLRKHL